MTSVLLDVTRTLYRQTRHATGIDRVETAYIDWAVESAHDALFLAKIGRSVAVLDATGLKHARRGKAKLDFKARMQPHRDKARRAVETRIRKHARAICSLNKLGDRDLFLPQTTYINVGHTHLTADLMAGLSKAGAARSIVMIHDTIPLDFPDLQTDASVKRFETFFRSALDADLLIANSEHTKAQVHHWAGEFGADDVKIETVPLGVDEPKAAVTPADLGQPYFVVLGTIEPRKNHELLLDIWDRLEPELGSATPLLLIVGRRGWASAALLERLDKAKQNSEFIKEYPSATDEEVTELVAGANALLFPSLAEGFGYPAFEAFQLGTDLICSELPVFQEFFGNEVLYISSHNVNKWVQEIITRVNAGTPTKAGVRDTAKAIPRWPSHFQKLDLLVDG